MGYSCLLKINFLAIYNVVFIIKSQWTILQKILLCKFLLRFLGLILLHRIQRFSFHAYTIFCSKLDLDCQRVTSCPPQLSLE